MANVSKLKYGDNTYDIKDASARHEAIDSAVSSGSTNLITSGAVKTYVDNSIAALPEPMIFKGTVGTGGTITSLPTAAASNEGFTYKVISNLSTPVTAKVGDTVISNGSAWTVIPSGDEPSGTVTNIAFAEGKVDNTAGISISGTNPITSSGTVTISHANTSSQASVNNSGRTYIQDITLDTYGHVTGIASATETVVDTDTTYTFASGTNGFTVTPKGGSAQTVNVTPNDTTKLPLTGGTLTGNVEFANGAMPLSQGKVTGLSAGATRVYGDGIAISNPNTANDVGFIRVLGTGEYDTVLEIATGDDGGDAASAETIAVRQYNTINQIAKEAKLLDPYGNTTFPGTVATQSVQVGGTAATMQYNSTNKCIDFVFA